MFKRLFLLFKIARKLASSGAIDTINEIYNIPTTLKIFFDFIAIGSNKTITNSSKRPGEKLCDALEGMGTTFIKLGQFLATRPDIIGQKLTDDLEKLQDKIPPFDLYLAKNILKKELGEENFEKLKNITPPVAAASIAQVHFANIEISGKKKDVAIKILRPNVEKVFNEELDALMFLAYIVESTIKKTKRFCNWNR